MTMMVYSMTHEDLNKNANAVKEAILGALERDGLLNKPADDICASYIVTLSEPGWFGRLFKRIRGQEAPKGTLAIDVFKVV